MWLKIAFDIGILIQETFNILLLDQKEHITFAYNGLGLLFKSIIIEKVIFPRFFFVFVDYEQRILITWQDQV